MTLAGREALRKRALAALIEMRGVIYEAEGLCHDFVHADGLSPDAKAILTDAHSVTDRVRALIDGQE